ncbi:transcription termination factor NusA [Patescibacteria group bacterium]|nr:transcription termination factor NusA [Patescibacteria group bacterium]MBU1028709.1 transcription termination factor NusA [Patescibacteria group bacterium]
MSSPIIQAIKQISEEKDISAESVIETIEAALAAAYRKDFGQKNQNIKVNFDPETGEFEVFDVKMVVEDMELPEVEETAIEGSAIKERGRAIPIVTTEGTEEVDEGPKFNPKTDIMLTPAQELKKGAQIGEEIRTKQDVPAAFGRMAAQTAKQVIIQKIREAERVKVFNEFKEREGELVNATVQRREGRMVLIDLGRATAVMPPDEQVSTERYAPGDRVKVYVMSVEMTTRGPEIIVSRTHPSILKKLFSLEIPEISAGTVEIHGVAREAGARAKVAVSSNQDNIDPIGSCIGQRGTRIQTIIAELGGEKVDVIQHDNDPAIYITNALSPAKVVEIELDEKDKSADVLVNEDQLSLAIGRGGQNVRLASRLTGWKINIRKVGEEGRAFVADEGGSQIMVDEQLDQKEDEAVATAEDPIEAATNETAEEEVVVDAEPTEVDEAKE